MIGRVLAGCLAAVLLVASGASAQPTRVDRAIGPLASPGARQMADRVSWATVGAALALDEVDRYRVHCRGVGDDCLATLAADGIRVGVTVGALTLIKRLAGRARPCAPGCADASGSFPSLHTALAFSAMGRGRRLGFTVPLAVTSGGLRIAAGRHWLTDTLAGAAAGAAANMIR